MTMKQTAKQLAQLLAVLLVLPLLLAERLLRKVSGDSFFTASAQFLSLLPGRTGSYLRLAFFRYTMPACSQEGYIGFGTLFSQRDTRLGRGIYIGPQCNIGSCVIGDDTLIASGVHIMSGTQQHRFSDPDLPIREQGGTFTPVHVGKDCWIGNGALVMADIGDKSVIGAGSVVTQAIPALSIAVGNPARVLRSRDTSEPVQTPAADA
jgi:virginiamycin A acetyltransferase